MASDRPLVVCWLDRSIGESGGYLDVKRHFEGISDRISSWKYFDCGDQFHEFINANPNITLIVIMSGSFSKQHLTPISDRNSLHSVYILCEHIERYKHLINQERHVQGVFNHQDDLYDRLQKDLQRDFP